MYTPINTEGDLSMKTAIIYKSKYGHAKAYAMELASLTGAQAHDISENTALSGFDCAVHVGGIYAGIVSGLNKTAKQAAAAGVKRLVVVTVGMTNPDDKAYYDKLATALKNSLPDIYKASVSIINVRGGVDYENMRGLHRLVMKLIINQIKKTPPEKRTAEDQAMIDTFGKNIDLTDLSALAPAVEAINA